MGRHRPETCRICHANGFERLGQGANLIQLDQNRIRTPLGDTTLQDLWIRHEEIVPDELDLVPKRFRHERPAIPIVLRQTVFDGDDRIARHPICPEIDHLRGIELSALTRQMVDAVLVELARRRIESDRNILARLVAGLIDRLKNQLEGFLVASEIRSKSSFVTDRSRVALL